MENEQNIKIPKIIQSNILNEYMYIEMLEKLEIEVFSEDV
jgi:hypothetical protein